MDKYSVMEALEACGRKDMALIIAYDGDAFYDAPEGLTKFKQNWELFKHACEVQKHSKFDDYNQERIWNDAVLDLKTYELMANKEIPVERLDGGFCEQIGKLGDGDSGIMYDWYPRYVCACDESETHTINPLMLKGTSYRCGHEHDCCGCTMYNDAEIEYYDQIHSGWILSQRYFRNSKIKRLMNQLRKCSLDLYFGFSIDADIQIQAHTKEEIEAVKIAFLWYPKGDKPIHIVDNWVPNLWYPKRDKPINIGGNWVPNFQADYYWDELTLQTKDGEVCIYGIPKGVLQTMGYNNPNSELGKMS